MNRELVLQFILHPSPFILPRAGAAGIEPAHSGLTDRRLTIRLHTPVRKKTAGLASSHDTRPAVEAARVLGIRSDEEYRSDSVSQIRAG